MNLPFAHETSVPRPPGEHSAAPTRLCLGIDPNPPSPSQFSDFSCALAAHTAFLRTLSAPFPLLKPNLGFFLRHGSAGIALLEKFTEEFRQNYQIILDGKFGEIGNTLEAYLDFVFKHLKVSAVTLNPFLGERTLDLAFESCAKHAGASGRVYVLCATSETGTHELSFVARNVEKIIEACVAARERVFGAVSASNETTAVPGVVVGANREDVLFSSSLRHSGLAVLAPGLGAQKASFGIVAAAQRQPENEIVFPVSRGIFEGGTLSLAQMQERYAALLPLFSRNKERTP